ncbi:MAG: 1-acyl-sn-glycerol-3-phosphate acyltransferase [Candidatus Aminicenantes bacterium]|nr:1-acyl-sn-glycerol-3-phosphate acyltransferase [Candidatus Aminicenantes bacterium]
MLTARHRRWGAWVFRPYIRRIVKKAFGHFYLANPFPAVPEDAELIVTPNHISWWDGFFIFVLLDAFSKRKMHLMMLERELKKHPYFRSIGAYSIAPEDRDGAMESLQYTSRALEDPGRLVVLFPQGKIQPFFLEEVSLKRGWLKFLESEEQAAAARGRERDIRLLMIAFGIEYHHRRKPEIWARFSRLYALRDFEADFDAYGAEFRMNLQRLKQAIADRTFIADIL